jgi:hypothetical protein
VPNGTLHLAHHDVLDALALLRRSRLPQRDVQDVREAENDPRLFATRSEVQHEQFAPTQKHVSAFTSAGAVAVPGTVDGQGHRWLHLAHIAG